MIVSTDWLAEYVDLPASVEELAERLTLAGLNLEEYHEVAHPSGKRDTAVDVEVTSNRPDCLGHVGVAREVAVLYGKKLRTPSLTAAPSFEPRPSGSGAPFPVAVDCPNLCPRYTARVIRGVKIGPSPDWLADRLRTLGIAVINNVVDVTNYVMMECGQPLHAFDLAKLKGGRIVVRKARAGEPFTAIDHREYTLIGDEVVIADAERPVALGGVMGGADSEVADDTVDLVIEAADFDPMTVRAAARRHALHSPSSYRFERGVDPEGVDWASRRCCDLILELAGGKLDAAVADACAPRGPRKFDGDRDDIKLRFESVPRLLGVDVPREATRQILIDLGCRETHWCDHCVKVVPPTWRADLTREVDLIEEVIRVWGYEKVPSRVGLTVFPSAKTDEQRAIERVREYLTSNGFDEAYTLSAVEPDLVDPFRPWGAEAPLVTATPVLRRADRLRQSVVPSLLACRRTNETLSNPVVELFEVAKVYLPQPGALPVEKRVLAVTSGGGFLELKGVIEGLVERLAPDALLESTPAKGQLLDEARSAGLLLNGAALCLLGEVSAAGRERFGLRGAASVAELDLGVLIGATRLVPTTRPLSSYPPVQRDVNLVVDERVRWADVERIARHEGGELVEQTTFLDDRFRDPQQLGAGKKSVVFRMQLRSQDGTLTSDQADQLVSRVVSKLEAELGGMLRG